MNEEGEEEKGPIWALFDSVPEDGIVVRDEADGFHARFTPLPPIPTTQVAGALAVWGLLCAVVAFFATDKGELQALIFAGGMSFGALMYAFHLGRGFFPVEVAASKGTLYFDGDRRPLSQIRTVELDGIDLRVTTVEGAVVGEVHGVPTSVGEWLVAAIQLMMDQEKA